MSIIDRMTKAYCHLTGKKLPNPVKRKQLNLTIDEEMILGVKGIARILEVPMYVAVEEMLQVGGSHLLKDLDDPEKLEKLKDHLLKVHLLGNEDTEGSSK